MRTPRAFATALLLLSLSCSGASSTSSTKPGPDLPHPGAQEGWLEAEIRWTSHGIPHIVASDLASLAFGQGYAFAKNHVCILADQIVKVRSERARFFGPGPNDVNIDTDFGYLALGLRERARFALESFSPDSRKVVAGFVVGYNHYLSQVGASGLPADCRDAEWVRPMDEIDMAAYTMDVAMLASSGYFLPLIGSARPHTSDDDKTAHLALPSVESALSSNAWAIGAERSETGRGMLVANPHFPWEGAHKFYEAHLTIPGELDAYGVQLMGMPLVSIAFNQHIAWTHTFSASTRFVFYRLRLDPDDPTRYRYGSETRDMTKRNHEIQVRQPDGSLAKVERTLYRSHYGPMLDAESIRWDATGGSAFTLRDAAEDITGMADQYLAMMRATDLTSFQAALARHQGPPFLNTVFADRDGNVFYADTSRVPNLSDGAIIAWELAVKAMPAVRAAWQGGLVVLDGSLPLFEWQEEEQPGAAGAVPFSRAPKLARRDFVFNANDGYWMINPKQPLAGFSPLYGQAEKALSPRSRMNLAILTDTGAQGPAGPDGKWSAAELERAALSNRSFMGELLRDEVVTRCQMAAAPIAKGRQKREADPDLAAACKALSKWDGRFDLQSRGAVLWREFLGSFKRSDYHDGTQFGEKFEPTRPVETPRGLGTPPAKGPDPVIAALRSAIERLRKAGVDPYVATLGQVQFTEKAGVRMPMHGGGIVEGVTNLVLFDPDPSTLLPSMSRGKVLGKRTGLTSGGYPVNYGTSFLLVLEFTDAGPVARAIMSYSASSDAASPHFKDQTEMWAKKQLRPVLFTAEQIASDPALKVERVRANPAAARD